MGGSPPPARPAYRRVPHRLLAAATFVAVVGCSAGARVAAPPVRVTPATTVAASATTTAAPTTTVGVAAVPTTSGPPSAPATAAPVPTTTATTATSAPPAFSSAVGPVTAARLGATWHAGCPVDPAQLRVLSLSYWGFDGHAHQGSIVVNASVADAVVRVFAQLYGERFPIRQMVPQSAYGGDDNAAAAADDTSGFNCRLAVASGPPQWSVHAYGEAIDVNDVENPYVDGIRVIPPSGAAYLDRGDVRPGMAVAGGTLVAAFASVGWQWGGRWTGSPDYQHFSSTGG
jgi:hypothetical protein